MDLTEGSHAHIERELLLIKIHAESTDDRAETLRMSDIFNGRVLDVTPSSYTIEMTGTSDKLDAFIKAFGKERLLEVARSGVSGIARGTKALRI